MLPNHSPLVIAEQFGTLEALYPGRIDLGLGRAPGTDQLTLRALRRSPEAAEAFPQDVLELQALLGDLQPGQRIQAVPGTGAKVPLWILGSSLFGAQLAAMLGLPFAFASHFAPDALEAALDIYRSRFEPSEQLAAPYAMVGCNVDRRGDRRGGAPAVHLRPAELRQYRAGNARPVAPPIDDIESYWSPAEKAHASRMLACSFVGTRQRVADGLSAFLERTGADEAIVAGAIYDHARGCIPTSFWRKPSALLHRLEDFGLDEAVQIVRTYLSDHLVGDHAVAAHDEGLRHAVDSPVDAGAPVLSMPILA